MDRGRAEYEANEDEIAYLKEAAKSADSAAKRTLENQLREKM